MFCENVVTLVGWMCKSYSTFGLFNMYWSSFFFFFFLSHWFVHFFLYIKRANRLMNSVMNNIFGLVTCLFPSFFFLQVHQLSLSFFFLKDFICLLCTCNVSLYCIHTKSSKYYVHLQKKKKKNVQILQICITFTNFYVFTI